MLGVSSGLVSFLLQEGLSEEQLAKARAKLELSSEAIISIVGISDPSPNKKYDTWILKQWMYRNVELPQEYVKLKTVLTHFMEQSRKQNSPIESNIFRYRTLQDLIKALSEVVPGLKIWVSSVEYSDMPGVKILKKMGPYSLLEISDPNSLAQLGQGTKWCTRKSYSPCHAYSFLSDVGQIYMILKGERPFMQYTPDYGEVKDVDNRTVEEFGPILQKLMEPPPEYITWSNVDRLLDYVQVVVQGPWPPGEELFAKDASKALFYARHCMKGRFPEGESVIAKDPEKALFYARHCMKGRFPEGESVIAKDPEKAYLYASEVLHGRFPEAEKLLSEIPYYAYLYALVVIQGPWPEAEETLAFNPFEAVNYAIEVLKGRFPEAEEKIAQNPSEAFVYARDVIRGRFPAAEPAFLKSPRLACNYAQYVIYGPWPEAEGIIATHLEYSYKYARYVLHGRFPAGEEVISHNYNYAYDYANYILDRKIPQTGPELPKGIAQYCAGGLDF